MFDFLCLCPTFKLLLFNLLKRRKKNSEATNENVTDNTETEFKRQRLRERILTQSGKRALLLFATETFHYHNLNSISTYQRAVKRDATERNL